MVNLHGKKHLKLILKVTMMKMRSSEGQKATIRQMREDLREDRFDPSEE